MNIRLLIILPNTAFDALNPSIASAFFKSLELTNLKNEA